MGSAGAELGAHLVAVRVVHLVEDLQGVRPRAARRPGVTGAVVDIAEAVERVGLVKPVGELPRQVNGALVALDGLLVGAAAALVDEALRLRYGR